MTSKAMRARLSDARKTHKAIIKMLPEVRELGKTHSITITGYHAVREDLLPIDPRENAFLCISRRTFLWNGSTPVPTTARERRAVKAIQHYLDAAGVRTIGIYKDGNHQYWQLDLNLPDIINVMRLPLRFAVARSTLRPENVIITDAATGNVTEMSEDVYPDVSKALCNLFAGKA